MGRSFALTVIVTVTLGSLAGCIAHSARPSCAQDRNEGVRPTIDILNSGRDSNQPSQGRDSEVVYLIDRANREAPSRSFRKRVDSLQRPPVRFVLVQWFHAKAGFSQYYNRFDGRLGHPREMNEDDFAKCVVAGSLLIYENEDEVGYISSFALAFHALSISDTYPGVKTGVWSKADTSDRPGKEVWEDVLRQLRELTRVASTGSTLNVAGSSSDGTNIGRLVRYEAGTTTEMVQVSGFEGGPQLPDTFEPGRIAKLLARLDNPQAKLISP